MQQNQPKSLWKNNQLIDQNGLIKYYKREREYDSIECEVSLENLMSKYQSDGQLNSHFSRIKLEQSARHIFETITYNAYLIYACGQGEIITDIGSVFIRYKIQRLNYNIQYMFPFLILFSVSVEDNKCKKCHNFHFIRVYRSNFEAIRTQFIMEVANKIKFMARYPLYNFQPSNFQSKRSYGETIYQRLKIEFYQPGFYYEKVEQRLANALKIHCIRQNIDVETVGYTNLAKIAEAEQMENVDSQINYTNYSRLLKTKFTCLKCQPKEIWTSKDKVHFSFYIIDLVKLPNAADKYIFDQNEEVQSLIRIKKNYEIEKDSNKTEIYECYGLQKESIDKSISRSIDQFEIEEKYLEGWGQWHNKLQDYKYPYKVVVKVEITQFNCKRCKQPKHGILYSSAVMEICLSFMYRVITERIIRRAKASQKMVATL